MNTDPERHLVRVDPEVWEHVAMRRALAVRDLAQVFLLLRRAGVSQRVVAAATSLAPSEVYEILRGRRVMAYDVLCRIADGLGVPRGRLGLAYDVDTEALVGARTGPTASTDEASEARALLAHAAEVTMGVSSDPARWQRPGDEEPTPVPDRLGACDVDHVEHVTAELRAMDCRYGGGACRDAVVAQALWVARLMHVDAADVLRHRLQVALADLHNLAGWTSLDVGLYRPARRHFAQAISQARDAGQPSLLANVLYRTGRLHLHRRLAVQALRFFQLGQIAAREASDPLTTAVLSVNEAWAHSMNGDAPQAFDCLHRAQDEYAHGAPDVTLPWTHSFAPADLHGITGLIHLELSCADAPAAHLAAAREQLTAALDARGDETARSRVFDLTALATACLRDHDLDEGIAAAARVVDLVGDLRSARVIDRLAPLVDELTIAPDNAATDLAQRLGALRAR